MVEIEFNRETSLFFSLDQKLKKNAIWEWMGKGFIQDHYHWNQEGNGVSLPLTGIQFMFKTPSFLHSWAACGP